MRKVLLASTALALMAGSAIAADSESTQVTATVSATCSLTDPDDVSFGTDPLVGAFDTSNFNFTCNFAGDGGEGALQLSIDSANGGLANVNDSEVRDYTVNYNSTGAVLASALPPSFPESSSAAGAANARAFVVTLAEALPVAGAYSDTLTVSIVP